jgi:undecaprenyl-diphosphatase
VAAAIVAAILLRRGAHKRPLIIAAAPFALSFVVYLLKGWYRVERPPAGLTSALTFSFPSGHTSGSTAVFAFIGFVLAREEVVPRPFGWLIACAIPLAVGLSRLFLDVHWASDVIGGWMIGAAYAAVVCVLYEHTRRLSRSPRP